VRRESPRGLIGNSRELSLVDLVQMKAHAQGTCRIEVQGPRGPGVLFVSGSSIVHAEYGGAMGADAASALLAEERVEYRATSDVPLPEPTMHADARALVLQAAVELDERRRGSVPARAAPLPGAPAAGGRIRQRLRAVLGGVAVAVVLAAVALARIQVGPSAAAAIQTPSAPSTGASGPAPLPESRRLEPVEASALTGVRDEVPVLVAGEPPRTPAPGLALRPTIVVRILVDEAGAVARAEVYQPRPDLEEYERAALASARALRFRPARRDGAAVPAWINWPVDFI
jgi:TonB family protein